MMSQRFFIKGSGMASQIPNIAFNLPIFPVCYLSDEEKTEELQNVI